MRVLQVAMSQGYLDVDEFTERSGQAAAARVRADIAPIIADLPAEIHPPSLNQPTTATATTPVVIEGNWDTTKLGEGYVVPPSLVVKSFAGNVNIEFDKATLTSPTVDIEVDLKGGGAKFYFPVGAAVEIHGGLEGSSGFKDTRDNGPVDPAVPTFRISGRMTLSSLRLSGPKRGWWD